MTLRPAYGRDYKSKAAVLADFNADKDFVACPFDGADRPTNRSDLVQMGIKSVSIRYAHLTKVVVVKL